MSEDTPEPGQVMLFCDTRGLPTEKTKVLMLLLPRNAPLDRVEMMRRQWFNTMERIGVPGDCELVQGRSYTLDCPGAERVTSKRAILDMNYDFGFDPSFVVWLDPDIGPVTLTLREEGSSEVVWRYTCDPSELTPSKYRTLLESVHSDFVKTVSESVLERLMERLLQEKVMNQLEVDLARLNPRAAKAQHVLDTVMKNSSEAASVLIKTYCELDPQSELSQRLQSGAEGGQRRINPVECSGPDSEGAGPSTQFKQPQTPALQDSEPGRHSSTWIYGSGNKPEGLAHYEETPDQRAEVPGSGEEATVSVQESTSNLWPTTNEHKWFKISERWREKLEELHCEIQHGAFSQIGSVKYVNDPKFCIGKGSDGTAVFLGLRDDGTELAIKRMFKSKYGILKNDVGVLRLPKLDHTNIVRYVDAAEDSNFGYLVLQLCEFTLEEYMENLKEKPIDVQRKVQKSLVEDVLTGLSVLHDQNPRILHLNLKPQNVLIDINGRARLADFGLSRKLPDDRSTLHTRAAGTKCWMAREILINRNMEKIPHKPSTDVQVAGMLVYYILSGGKHPFDLGNDFEIESNMYNGKYSLELVEDVVAKDLIEQMIQIEPELRPNVKKCSGHPFFWDEKTQLQYLIKVGNCEEIEKDWKASEELISAMEKLDVKMSLKNWKSKFPEELIKKMEEKRRRPYPEHPLGLLRFIRNTYSHPEELIKDEANIKVTELFPDLFGITFTFAKTQGWNEEPPLREMFQREGEAPGGVKPSPAAEEEVSELKRNKYTRTSSPRDSTTLLESVHPDFVQTVSESVLQRLMDRLLWENMMNPEEVEKARAKPGADKARHVLDTVRMKGPKAASVLIKTYCELDPQSELSQRLQSGAEGGQRRINPVECSGPDSEGAGPSTQFKQPQTPALQDYEPGKNSSTWISGSRNQPEDPAHYEETPEQRAKVPGSGEEATATNEHKWFKISKQWREKLEELHSEIQRGNFIPIGSVKYVNDQKFCIGKGSDGTVVFLGLKDDGTEVAIKRMSRLNYDILKIEQGFLRLPKLDHPNIVRYVDVAEDVKDPDFVYLVLQLCEFTLKKYLENLKEKPIEVQRKVQKSLVLQVLTGLSVLHDENPRILHRDIKPKNVLIDISGRARLADFGISRKLPDDGSTHHTRGAGTKGWMANEILANINKEKIPHKSNADVQVAGMLVYYILSGGKHPFDLGHDFEIESNIYNGKYSLEFVEDVVAKDLIKQMIQIEPELRPDVKTCLGHPFFWDEETQLQYLIKVGNCEEIEKDWKASDELISAMEKLDLKMSLKNWKSKFPEALVKKKEKKRGHSYPEHPLGLLRFIRNIHEHPKELSEEEANIKVTKLFPDLFGITFTFAKEQGWNEKSPLRDMFQREGEE